MSPISQLALYALGIALGSLLGAAVPLARPPHPRRTRLLLSFAAGVMLGTAFFHMLPESIEEGGMRALAWVPAGFLFLYLLERYVLVHVCGEPENGCEVHHHEEPPGAKPHGHAHGTLGIATFVGLTLHTLTDGLALGAATDAGVAGSVFLAILLHKIPSSFSLAAILLHDHHSPRRTLFLSVVFSLAVPVGAALYFAVAGVADHEKFGPYTLAFSAGTFLHLAVADIIPDLHRDRAMRLPLSVALLLGTTLMWAVSALGPAHGH
jgi:zinc and cadmium transporter